MAGLWRPVGSQQQSDLWRAKALGGADRFGPRPPLEKPSLELDESVLAMQSAA